MDLKKTELTDLRLEDVAREKARWSAIIQQWDALMPMDPVPMFTRDHAEKMIKKLG